MTNGRTPKTQRSQSLGCLANPRGTANRSGTRSLTLTLGLALGWTLGFAGCALRPAPAVPAAGLHVATAPAPSESERYCAWYGTAAEGVLYFGQAPFWSAMRAAGGDPTADLHQPGPQRIGRFDLAEERWLPALEVGGPEKRSGVWDVAFHAGRVFFSTFYEPAGAVDPETGFVQTLGLGGGLNEWAPGPDGSLLVTRYGSGHDEQGNGSVLRLDADGALLEEWPLSAPAGYRNAPKTPSWDSTRNEAWVTTDLLPVLDPSDAGSQREASTEDRHDAFVLGRDGRPTRTVAEPEVQFVAQGVDGRFYRAEVEHSGAGTHTLWAVIEPADPADETVRVLLDPAFPAALDFVQDVQPSRDGRVAITRWSGRVHVLDRAARAKTVDLPRLDPDGLYYTAVLWGDRVCATYCADVTVVCADAP
ncbi:MAG: hypothetical protein AAF430_06640 [Myxococcota bacterium]